MGGDGRGGIDCPMNAVVVSRYGEGVSVAIRRTEGVGAGGHVQRRSSRRMRRCRGWCEMTNKNDWAGEGQRSGGGNGHLRSEERASQPSDDSCVLCHSLFLGE